MSDPVAFVSWGRFEDVCNRLKAAEAERDRLRALLRKALPEVEGACAPLSRDVLNEHYRWLPGWLREARALLGESRIGEEVCGE